VLLLLLVLVLRGGRNLFNLAQLCSALLCSAVAAAAVVVLFYFWFLVSLVLALVLVLLLYELCLWLEFLSSVSIIYCFC